MRRNVKASSPHPTSIKSGTQASSRPLHDFDQPSYPQGEWPSRGFGSPNAILFPSSPFGIGNHGRRFWPAFTTSMPKFARTVRAP